MQLPTLPDSVQLSHWPVHAVLQQKPSAQWPDTQAASSLHVAPFTCFCWHVPAPQ